MYLLILAHFTDAIFVSVGILLNYAQMQQLRWKNVKINRKFFKTFHVLYSIYHLKKFN